MKCPKCESTAIVGVEVMGVYDGVLWWYCEICGHAWARDWGKNTRRQEIAENYVQTHNRAMALAATASITKEKL